MLHPDEMEMQMAIAKLKALDDEMDWAGVMDWLQDTWIHDYGVWACHKNAGGDHDIYLSTGGWSENEEIMCALETTMFWFFFWQESKRGGHYKLTVRVDQPPSRGRRVLRDA